MCFQNAKTQKINMKKKMTKPEGKELSLDDSLDEIIDMKKNENSALKKIVESLVKEYLQDNTNKK